MRWDARSSGSGTGPLGLRGSGSGVLEVAGVNFEPSLRQKQPPVFAAGLESEKETEWSRIRRNPMKRVLWRKQMK